MMKPILKSVLTGALLLWSQFALAQLPPGAGIVINQTPVQGGSNGQCLFINNAQISSQACGSGSGTVTSVSVTSANGVSGSVATPTTTPAISLTLGAITPTSVNGYTITPGSGTLAFGAGGTVLYNGGALGTPASGVATNFTGTAAGLTAGNVTTNANLTGDTTSVGNATTTTKISGVTPGGACAANNFASSLSTSAVPTCAIPGANSATLSGAQPADPTGTASATIVMMGLGTTCKLTTTYSTRMSVTISGNVANTGASNTSGLKLFYGSGTAPANAAVPTGNQYGAQQTPASPGGNLKVPFTWSGKITGLGIGTATWFDIGLLATAGTSSISNLTCDAAEY